MRTPTIELIHRHGSVRDYKTDPVPIETIETIVAAGQRASTSSNLQMYSVVVVTDADKRARLMSLCGDQEHIGQAPVYMAWCADLSRLERVCEHQGYNNESDYMENLMLAVVDAALAMQNAALAAESLGLGFCYIGGIRNYPDKVIRLLELPPLVFPICGMTLGWPLQPARIRPRLPLEAVLHWETYQSDHEAHLRAYDQTMIETGIYDNRQVDSDSEEHPQDEYGWMEHSARRASKVHRPGLREALLRAGFEMK